MFNNQMLFDRRMTVRVDRDSERSDSRPPKLPEGLRSIGMGLGAGGNPLHDVPRNYLLLSLFVFHLSSHSMITVADLACHSPILILGLIPSRQIWQLK